MDANSETMPHSAEQPLDEVDGDIFDWLDDACDEGICEATDGCIVEVDGRCPHGKPSWALVMGLV